MISLYLIQPGPDSIGIVAVSRNCNGVAARACGLVSLEPMKVLWNLDHIMEPYSVSCICLYVKSVYLLQVAEILKDRLSWFRDCRCVDVLSVISTGNGGTIELLYMQVSSYHYVLQRLIFGILFSLLAFQTRHMHLQL